MLDSDPTDNRIDIDSRRRKLLAATSLIGTGFMAGCIGDDDEDDDDDDGTGDDADGTDGDADGDPMLADVADFDPANPAWDEHNYPGSILPEHDIIQGSRDDLDRMGDRGRDEPVYGDAPREHPEDSDEWIDPDPIVFAEVAGEEEPGVYEDMMEPVMNELAENTGRDVEWANLEQGAPTIEAMRGGHAHVVYWAVGNVPFGVNLAGMVPMAMGIGPEGRFGYRMFAATHADNDDIQSVEDFERDDVRVGHTDPASNSGHQAPSALFDSEFDVQYEPEFAGGHSQLLNGIEAGDYDAGPMCSTCMDRAVDAGHVDWDDFKILWGSEPFPAGVYGYRYNLHPEIIEGARETWLETDWHGTDYVDARNLAEFVEIDYANHYHDILTIQQFNDVDYDIDEA